MFVSWRLLGLMIYFPTVVAETDRQNWVGKLDILPSIETVIETPQAGYLAKPKVQLNRSSSQSKVNNYSYRYQPYKFTDLSQLKKQKTIDLDKDGISDEQKDCKNTQISHQSCILK